MDSGSAKNVKLALQNKVSRKEAEKAVETLIKWAGDDPEREGLKETPKRVINAYEEFFSGYKESADKYLSKTFEDVQGYQDMVMLKDIPLLRVLWLNIGMNQKKLLYLLVLELHIIHILERHQLKQHRPLTEV